MILSMSFGKHKIFENEEVKRELMPPFEVVEAYEDGFKDGVASLTRQRSMSEKPEDDSLVLMQDTFGFGLATYCHKRNCWIMQDFNFKKGAESIGWWPLSHITSQAVFPPPPEGQVSPSGCYSRD